MGFLRKIMPPIIYDKLIFLKKNKYGWFGDYPSWDEAQKSAKGYDANSILDNVRDALMKVKEHKAVYERDSVLFDNIEYSWPLLSGLLTGAKLAAENILNIIDFGGSLGSSYYQNRLFLENVNFRWNIVEQKKFVECGTKYFEDDKLRFYYDIEACYNSQMTNVLILSSVLQYLENPLEFLKQVVHQYDFDYILIDRTSFIKSDKPKITIQVISPSIYEASYPCWFLCENELLSVFTGKYEIMADFIALDVSNIKDSYYKGFILKFENERAVVSKE